MYQNVEGGGWMAEAKLTIWSETGERATCQTADAVEVIGRGEEP